MRMFRVLGALLLLATPLAAQGTNPVNSRSLTAVAASCTASSTGCLIVGTTGSGGLGVDIRGTFTATVQFEGLVSSDTTKTWVAVNCTPYNSTTAVTSTTAAGSWGCAVGGLSFFRVRVSAYTSGTIDAVTRTAATLARASSGGGGGGGTPGGTNTQLQFNNSGSFGGIAPTWQASGGVSEPSYLAVGPDTYTPSGWSGFNVSLEAYRQAASATLRDTQELYVETTASGIASASTYSAFLLATGSTASVDQSSLTGLYADASAYTPAAHTLSSTYGANVHANHRGLGTVSNLLGSFAQVDNLGGGTVTTSDVYQAAFYNTLGTTTNGSLFGGYWLADPAGSVRNFFGVYITDLTVGTVATNPYYLWFDSRGVFRVKEDNTFDSLYQAIPALYNPQYAKYLPGTKFFERDVMAQWNGNVVEYGTEAGATVTLTSLTSVSTTATATLVGMNPPDGAVVTISGATPSAYNGTYTITRVDDDHFTYTFAGGTSPATGTITAQGGTLRGVRMIGASLSVNALKTTGSASGKKTVCVDTSTGQLYASSTGTDCSN